MVAFAVRGLELESFGSLSLILAHVHFVEGLASPAVWQAVIKCGAEPQRTQDVNPRTSAIWLGLIGDWTCQHSGCWRRLSMTLRVRRER